MEEPRNYPPEMTAGGLRATPVQRGFRRQDHPDAPRVLERWTGRDWELHGIARDLLSAGEAMLTPHSPGRGRHRGHPAWLQSSPKDS